MYSLVYDSTGKTSDTYIYSVLSIEPVFKRISIHSFHLIRSTDDFRWIREVFMSSTIGFRRMGRKLDMEKDDGFMLHLLERDSQAGNVTSHNVVDAIDHSKRVVIILST